MKKTLYVVSCIALICAVPAIAAQSSDYTLLESNPLEFSAPIVHDKTVITQAPAGTIVYDNNAQAFYGLTPSGNPSSAGSWIQLGGSLAGGSANVSSNASGQERIERAVITCSSSSSIASQSGSWISIGNISSGSCAVTIANGVFSAAPTCVLTYSTSGTSQYFFSSQFSNATTGLVSGYNQGAGTPATSFVANVICMGPR